MQVSLFAKLRSTIGYAAISAIALMVALGSAVSLPANAQGPLYTVVSPPSVAWGQEPLYMYTSNGTGYVDNPATTGSAYGSIRMNAVNWADIMRTCNTSYTATPPTSWSDYDFTDTIDRYKNTFGTSASLLYTWYHTPECVQPVAPQGQTVGPNHIYSSGPCYFPLTGSAEDCYTTSFWNGFMQHVCGLSAPPSKPVSTCWIKNYELWNEMNASQFWTQSNSNLAKMGADAAKVIRTYCSDCIISAGSTSGGGAGGNTASGYCDPSDPTGGCHAFYDTTMGNFLDEWYTFSQQVGTGMPDFVSWHPYPMWYEYVNSNNVTVPSDPAPFPEFAYSGDGSGHDTNDGGGSDFHNGSQECPSTVTNEYSEDYVGYDGTAQYLHCGDSIVSQVTKMKSIMSAHHMSGKPLWATEGGFYDEFDIQGTETGMTGLTARDFLRTNWLARWLILLNAGGVARTYPYAYDTDGGPYNGSTTIYAQTNKCFMPLYIPKQVSTETTFYCNEGGFTGDGWSSDFDQLTAGAQTPSGNAWIQVQKWIDGAQNLSCSPGTANGYNIYSCTLTRSAPSGYHATIYWVTDWNKSDTSFVPTPPSGKHFTQYQWLDDPGGYISYTDGNVRGISGEPIMFEGIN